MAPVPYVFIGDDFTGASDTLATLAERGWRTRLYLETPSGEAVGREQLEAVGIATDLRASAPDVITRQLDLLAPEVAALNPRVLHYKVCSTFDSSVQTGNIGVAVGALERHLQPLMTAIIGGQPGLGRYCAFATLFARAGDGETHRIDRHPVMRSHPVTPMAEADLRRHLAAQGLGGLQLVSLTEIAEGTEALCLRLREALRSGQKRFLFDATEQRHLEIVGRALNAITGSARPLLVVGASSVAEALSAGRQVPECRASSLPAHSPGDPCFIVAGSRSSVTARQVATAGALEKRAIAPEDLENEERIDALAEKCCAAIRGRRHILVHLLPAQDYGLCANELSLRLADLVQRVLSRVALRSLGIAGGDTSSIIAQNIGLESIEFETRLGNGVAICAGRSRDPRRDGLRVMFKGGQVGAPDIFDAFARGT